MQSVKCRPSYCPKTRVLINLWYRNHIANIAENGMAWSITDTELSAPTIQSQKLHYYCYCSQNTEKDSKVSPVIQHVFTETNPKRRVDPHYQFFKHERITQKDYHNSSQNRNPPHTTADLKNISSCSYLESVSPLYSNSQFIVWN